MKTFLKVLLIVIVSLVVFVVSVVGFAVRFPQHYFRQEWAIGYLKKQDFAKDWRWKHLSLGLTSPAWLDYRISLETEDFNASYDSESSYYEIEKADISARVRVTYSFRTGLKILPLSPLKVHANDMLIVLKSFQDEIEPEASENFRWKELLKELHELSLPNLNLKVAQFRLQQEEAGLPRKPLVSFSKIHADYEAPLLTLSSALDLHLKKTPPLDILLKWETDKLVATASTKNISLFSKPRCEVSVQNLDRIEEASPVHLKCTTAIAGAPFLSKLKMPPLPLSLDLKTLVAHDLGNPALKQVRLELSSPNPTWSLLAKFEHTAVSIDRIRMEPARAIEELLPNAEVGISIPKLKHFLKTFPSGYDEAPAPISAMDGPITLQLRSSIEEKVLTSRIEFSTHLQGAKQEIKLRSSAEMPWDPRAGALTVSVWIDKFLLMLPRVSIREPLPALVADSRIQHGPPKDPAASKKKPAIPDWTLALKTEDPVSFRTSLLKDEFKFLLDLVVGPEGPVSGRISLLPMKAEVLRRPIELQEFYTQWNTEGAPTLKGRIRFPLPEYEIFLKVEGPLDSPRTALESKPPLATDDIYSVLLFGRPMSELDPEGRQGISRVKQGLAQGFFSLSTLYLLAGSRIESLGFDPNSNDVTAQLRLDKKHTLRVGTDGRQGNVALRRSLGGGWFIESSAQEAVHTSTQSTNFGLLLQRIIAY